MDNLAIYERVRSVPDNAKKAISAGRLKGMTDINPMWRIKILTELFGVAGDGWRFENVRFTKDGSPVGAEAVQCELDLYVKYNGEMIGPIHGVGGAMLVAAEKTGLRLDDEAYKKAYTDAQSVACKALGIGADVYWSKDSTKYTAPQSAAQPPQNVTPPQSAQPQPYQAAQTILCDKCGKPIQGYRSRDGKQVTPEAIKAYSLRVYNGCFCMACQKKLKEAAK